MYENGMTKLKLGCKNIKFNSLSSVKFLYYIIFLVNNLFEIFINFPCCAVSIILTLISDVRRTLQKATYSYPWLKTGLSKYSPTLSNVWPCALFTVMAKANCTGMSSA